MRKKILILTVIFAMFMGVAVCADTVEYDITVNKTATQQDNLSYKVVKKDDGDNWFYVTPTYYDSDNAAFFARSYQYSGSVYSSLVYVENGLNETRDGEYKTTAPGNVYYYMQTSYGYSATGSVNSRGRYTP